MKKFPLILISLFAYCNTFSQGTVTFDIKSIFFAQTYYHAACPDGDDPHHNRQIIPAGTYEQTIFGYQWRSVSGSPGSAWYGKNPLVLGAHYSPTPTWNKSQDGFTIKGNFRAGFQYRVQVECYFNDIDPNYGYHPPTLQLQLTNTPDYTYGRDCFEDAVFNPPLFNLMTFYHESSKRFWAWTRSTLYRRIHF